MTNSRPVVALDIDDVLNIPEGDGTVAHLIEAPAHTLPRSPFLRGGGQVDLVGTVHLRPQYGPWISALREHADVVWATTWEHAANTYIAPLLGIEPLEVGISTAEHPPRFGYVKNGDSAAWKAEALADKYEGRPLAWIDDSAWAYVPAFEEDRWRREPTLVIAPDRRVGITFEQMAQVEEWVRAPYTPKVPTFDL